MKKIVKITLWTLLGIVLLPFLLLFCLYHSADMGEPSLHIDASNYVVTQRADTLECAGSYLLQDSSGLWELYVEGSGQERGARQGALTRELMRYQEDVFITQIRNIIPSDRYLSLLRSFLIIFNRNMGKYVPDEYRHEIAAMSQFCTHEYDAIGSPYERQLNYHGAHDIGHTMQQYMLVGCSSFAAWGAQTPDSALLVGRNFDFYMGEDFARNKLITFAVPDSGFRYVSIGWAGMLGVLSGMNQQGLTVTINAAQGAMPTSSATPISILTREILQYASTIEQAYHIAQRTQTFVSESILIGSATDHRAALIEKTPHHTELYSPAGELLVSTNHYQSQLFASDSYNQENIELTDSKFRQDRLLELLHQPHHLTPTRAAEVLRDRSYLGGADMGIGNELSVNQSIAHHSVIFLPSKGQMWVSTSPWQSGKMVCYELKGFFDNTARPHRSSPHDIAADTLFERRDHPRLLAYRDRVKQIRRAIQSHERLADGYIDSFLTLNPHHYNTYRSAGEYFSSQGQTQEAIAMYRKALECAIPSKKTRSEIEKQIQRENE